MKKNVFKSLMISAILISFSLFITETKAQKQSDEPVLMTIGSEKVTGSEFLRIYKKNNLKNEQVTKKSLDDYLNLYINFRLKVEEAKEMKLDTAKAFQKELAGYREQLAQPYLTDSTFTNALLKESYQRMQSDIRVSHILIKLPVYASPKDTAEVYNKLMDIRRKILNGESFEKMAVEYSEDPYARNQEANSTHAYAVKGNKGDLGYFTAFDMVYPFETAAYSLEPGQISLPVRTSYGYHLIKVTDKQKALGKILAAHIFIMAPFSANDSVQYIAKHKIEDIYQKMKSGNPFDSLVKKYSEDRSSAMNGGKLRWFTVSRMVPEFIETIYKLNPEECSKPIQTQYGWHIVKLIEKKRIEKFEDIKTELKEKITKDNRSTMGKNAMVNNIKKEYNFKENKKSLKKFYPVVDTLIFVGKWDITKAKDLTQPMFTLGNNSFTQQNFANYISTNQTKANVAPDAKNKLDKNVLVNDLYKNFVETSCINFLNNELENKFPDFKALMKEYLDGMLLFELTDKKVWSKSVKDSAGLANFYQDNKSKYMWDERLNASVFTCANKTVADDVKKQIIKSGKNYNSKALLALINKSNPKDLKIDSASFSKNENKAIDAIKWIANEKPVDVNIDSTIKFVIVYKVLAPQPKTLDEAKGIITADYQDYLEKQWITDLKKKYVVNVNNDIFNSLVK